MYTAPVATDPDIRRVLGQTQPWLVAGAGALWMLMLGVGTLLMFQVVRGEAGMSGGLSGIARLVALADLMLLMVGVALMALSLGRQARAISSLLSNEGTVDDVLRLVRNFWWIFAATLIAVSLLGCGTLFAGAAGAIQGIVEQVGGDE